MQLGDRQIAFGRRRRGCTEPPRLYGRLRLVLQLLCFLKCGDLRLPRLGEELMCVGEMPGCDLCFGSIDEAARGSDCPG